MKLQILGCHAATPRYLTHPSSQVLQAGRHLMLIDCGEGTQMQLRRYRVRFSRIDHIFISHLHGDHFFGLPGLISTFRLLGRETPLHIYGPKGIKDAITLLLKLGDSWTSYPLHFHELTADTPQTLFEDGELTVTTLPLDHRIYTNGFLFELSEGQYKLHLEEVRKYGIDRAYYRKIKLGKDVPDPSGRIIPNKLLTLPPPPAKKYAYCSDTAFMSALAPLIQGVDTLYHEATFLESHAALAAKTGHSTAREAAQMALQAEVGQLILGHFSTRYKELERFREEAHRVFPRVELAADGKVFEW
ncbi:MAG: ribonuclease Z [Robiginitalea sp.]